MIFAKYFFRIDDVAPNMNWDGFYRLAEIFKKYGVKPLLGVIPDVRDPKLTHWPQNDDFWNIVAGFADIGWVIGQHGHRHLIKGNGGVLKVHNNGEFGGLDFETQNSMIAEGKEILKSREITPEIFIAPRHSFDKNTALALKENDFSYISDGIALYPFKKWGIVWLPQVLWRPRKWLFLGMATVALHPNTMTEKNFIDLEYFIKNNSEKIGDFPELMDWYEKSGVLKKIIISFINPIFEIIWRVVFKIKHGLSR